MPVSCDAGGSDDTHNPPVDPRPNLSKLISFQNDTAEPLYRQLEAQLRGLIANGTYAPGSTLPAERSLCDLIGVSRTTVTRCYAALRDAGLVRSAGRLGFIVTGTSARLNPGMDRLKGFTEEMSELGRVPSSKVLEFGVRSDRAIASLFDLPSNTPLLKVERVRSGDSIPLSHEVAWYNLSAVPSLAGFSPEGSIYRQLAASGTQLCSCEQSIEATLPTSQECRIFGFTSPLPCLLIKRKSYDGAGRMIEYVEGLFRGDQYAYRLKLGL